MSVTPVETPTTTPVDPAKPVTPEVPSSAAPKDDMSAKFAALARKERMNHQLQRQIKAKEQSFAERERQIAERERLWENEFRQSPLEALKRRNLTYQDITNAALNDGKFDPATEVKSVREEIERLRQEQDEREQRATEQQKTQAQAAEAEAIERFKGSISDTIDKNKDKYELTHLYEASNLVFDTVEEHFLRTSQEGKPKILSAEEACELVEQYLESEIERTATTSKKFQAKYATAKPTDPKQAPKTSTTLNNGMQTSTSAAPLMTSKAVDDDRMKRAMAALG